MDVGRRTEGKQPQRGGVEHDAVARRCWSLQVSISLVLLVGAGLFLRTLHNLRSVDIGSNPQNLVFVRVDAEGAGLSDERKFRFLQDGMDRLQSATRRESMQPSRIPR